MQPSWILVKAVPTLEATNVELAMRISVNKKVVSVPFKAEADSAAE